MNTGNQDQKKPQGSPNQLGSQMNKGAPARAESHHAAAQNNPSTIATAGVTLAMAAAANNSMSGSDQMSGPIAQKASATQ
jgi:hypothetical protein